MQMARKAPTDIPAIAAVERLVLEAGVLELVEEAAEVGVSTPLVARVVLGEGKPGRISNAGERLTLLELESSMSLNLYCWVVGISEGMSTVARPSFCSEAFDWRSVSLRREESRWWVRRGLGTHTQA